MYTENLDDYRLSKPTDSCYLDSRYFYKVFVRYPGVISQPLKIDIYPNEVSEKIFVSMDKTRIDAEQPGLLRVVIQTPTSRHCNLVILDYNEGKAYRFEPLGIEAPYFNQINKAIEEYLTLFLRMELEVIDIDLEMVLDDKNPACLARGERTGFCTAYIILYAYAYLNGKDFNPYYIRNFVTKIEETYGSLPEEGKEVEYGLLSGERDPNQGQKMLLGGLGGAAIGGLAGGAGGAVLGGVGGLALGGLL